MPCAREGADLIQRVSGRYPNGRWTGWDVFTRRFWRNPYLLHDTFGKRWSRLVGCPVLGHRRVQNVADPGQPVEWHCFNCETRLPLGAGAQRT